MVNSLKKLIPICAVGMILSGCNIEVGNPDGDPPSPIGRSVQSLSINLQNAGACDSSAVHCASAPVTLSDAADARLSVEMQKAQLTMGSVTLKPFAPETALTSLDLISGSTVNLAEARDSADVSGVLLQFESLQSPTLQISGYLSGFYDGAKVSIPLEILYRDNFSAETSVSSGQDRLEGLLFDASTWFDSTSPGTSLSLRPLIDGVCKNGETAACVTYKQNLARQLSQRISRSMTAKTTPASGRTHQPMK